MLESRPSPMTKLLLGSLAMAGAGAVACAGPRDAGSNRGGFTGVNPQIAQAIAGIKAVDNHAHPVRPTAPGESPDEEFDALPVDNLEAQSDPIRQRPASPDVIAASRELFGGDKAAAMRAHQADYATWVLDRLGVDVMFANRVAMGPGLPASRF